MLRFCHLHLDRWALYDFGGGVNLRVLSNMCFESGSLGKNLGLWFALLVLGS